MEERIDPKELINELSVEELCETAEEYFANLDDYTFQMVKPFGGVMEAPDLLYNMSLLLSGLRLGQSMTVLDFGAGTCWFSRFLNQMQCATICVDPSPTALEIGRELFEQMPIMGKSIAPPQFLPFDGHSIDVPDSSVDRVVCFDSFHHVANVEAILREFYRVLKDGGIVGFSEPGRLHSQSAQSQYEMRNYKVLENDIRLEEIKKVAEDIGFGELRIKMVHPLDLNLTYDDYIKITKWRFLPLRLWHNIRNAMRQKTIFFFTKGSFTYDSRSHIGLHHTIEILAHDDSGQVGKPVNIRVRVYNAGQSKWLHQNIREIGVVKIGVHLYSAEGQLLDLDFARQNLAAGVLPGEAVTVEFPITFSAPGLYKLAIDLVAEQISWFENLGSQPETITVNIE